jgi:hypothetical protein
LVSSSAVCHLSPCINLRIGALSIPVSDHSCLQVGPRLELEVVKVEEGLCDGRVLFHKYEQRSAQAVAEQQAEWEAKEDLRQQRRQQQVQRAGCRWALTAAAQACQQTLVFGRFVGRRAVQEG